jgi:large subunit ribosomal protein L25
VSDLEIGQHISVGDLQLPADVTTEADPEETIVTAKLTSLALAEEEEEVEGEEGEEEEGAEGEGAEGAPTGEGGEGDSGQRGGRGGE